MSVSPGRHLLLMLWVLYCVLYYGSCIFEALLPKCAPSLLASLKFVPFYLNAYHMLIYQGLFEIWTSSPDTYFLSWCAQEPVGGAHSDPMQTSLNIKAVIMKHMKVSSRMCLWLMKSAKLAGSIFLMYRQILGIKFSCRLSTFLHFCVDTLNRNCWRWNPSHCWNKDMRSSGR